MNFNTIIKKKIAGLKSGQYTMPSLRVGDVVARVPIIQGGMGVGISLSKLASAVSEQGGIGVIAANAIGMLEKDYYSNGREANIRALRREIRKAKELTQGPIGVNIMVALNDFDDMLRTAIEERADLIFLGAGLPLKNIPIAQINQANIKVLPIVSSARAAALIFKYWQKNYQRVPDGIVVEGPLAGGHLGFKPSQIDDPFFRLENILPEVITEVRKFEMELNRNIPVIAAGGIYTSEDIYKFLEMGASGVQMGSRFVATHECDASEEFKNAYIESKKEDIIIIESPVGLPGRAINNTFLEQIKTGARPSFKCAWKCLASCGAAKARYCISEALNHARLGKLDKGYAFAGANAYRIEKIVRVRELIVELKEDYKRVVERGTATLREEYERAVGRLLALKSEYVKTVEKGVRRLKDEFDLIMEKGTVAFRDEINKTLPSIERLKAEYSEYFNRLNEIRVQLSRLLDISTLESTS